MFEGPAADKQKTWCKWKHWRNTNNDLKKEKENNQYASVSILFFLMFKNRDNCSLPL